MNRQPGRTTERLTRSLTTNYRQNAIAKLQDLRKSIVEAQLVGAHRRAPFLYIAFMRKS